MFNLKGSSNIFGININNNENFRKSLSLFPNPNADGNKISARKKNSKVSFKNESNNQLKFFNNTLTEENENNNQKSRKKNLFESNISKISSKEILNKNTSKKKHNFSDSSFDSSASPKKNNKSGIKNFLCCL